VDLIDIHRLFHPTIEYTFFPLALGPFSNIDYMLSHKTGQIVNIEIIMYLY
jgi:hypothetical protein